MAKLNNTFNLSEMDATSTIPEGSYLLSITEASIEQTKSGNGEYLKIKCQVLGPASAGYVIYQNINIVNASVDAEKIGRRELARLMQAVGIQTLTDTDQLLGATFVGKVKVQPESDGFDASNYISGYKKAENVAQSTSPAGTQTAFSQPERENVVERPKARPW